MESKVMERMSKVGKIEVFVGDGTRAPSITLRVGRKELGSTDRIGTYEGQAAIVTARCAFRLSAEELAAVQAAIVAHTTDLNRSIEAMMAADDKRALANGIAAEEKARKAAAWARGDEENAIR